MDLVSVIIPCYNRASLVGEAISSALDQSYEAVEIIVVDDGSTDESWSVIQSFGDAIRAIRIANGGAGRARNHGIAIARGKYLKFLDSDDLLPTNALPKMVAATKELPERAFLVGQAHSIDARGAPLPIQKYNYKNLLADQEVPRTVLLSHPTSVSMPLFLRVSVSEVGGFREDLILSEDYELMLRLHRFGYRAFYTAILSALVREHPMGRITTTHKPEAFTRAHLMYEKILTIYDDPAFTPLSLEERILFAQLIFSMARRAARQSYKADAEALFSLAYRTAGPHAIVAKPVVKWIYRLFPPYTTEKITQRLKSIFRSSV